MIELLEYSFMHKALIASLLLVILCGISGVLIVVNRMVFISGGVAHASYGGIGVALFLGLSPTLGALFIAVLLGLLLGYVRQSNFEKADALLNAFWAAGMALGIILNELQNGYYIDFSTYLFGNILLVSSQDLWISGIMCFIIIILTIKYYDIILICSADQDYATSLGIPVRKVNRILLVLLCCCVVLLMKMSGLILVMALISIPASIAETIVKKLSSMMILSGLIVAFALIIGLYLAVVLNTPPGAVMVGVLTILYTINIIVFWKK